MFWNDVTQTPQKGAQRLLSSGSEHPGPQTADGTARAKSQEPHVNCPARTKMLQKRRVHQRICRSHILMVNGREEVRKEQAKNSVSLPPFAGTRRSNREFGKVLLSSWATPGVVQAVTDHAAEDDQMQEVDTRLGSLPPTDYLPCGKAWQYLSALLAFMRLWN